MKKIISLFLIALFVFSLVGCGGATSGNTDSEISGEQNSQNTVSQQDDTVSSPYKVTEEQWNAAFEYGEDGITLLRKLENHTCHYISDSGLESIYKQVPSENLYYEKSISYEREYYYDRKGDFVDVYTVDSNGLFVQNRQIWENYKSNALGNFMYDINYFALANEYNSAEYSEEEKAYIYTNNCEIKAYFENGKLVRLKLVTSTGATSDYTGIGTTTITLPAQ